MEKTNYKTMKEIMNGVSDRIHYSRHAEQLASLALTKFAERITEKGATILSCSPKTIKLDDGEIIKVVGMYLKYTYNLNSVYYIQFDNNPFFQPQGYITDCRGYSTGLAELPEIFYGVNEYAVNNENIKQLTQNIFTSEKYLKNLKFIYKDKEIKKIKQEIYYNC